MINYLETVINNGNHDQIIHNYLLHFYVNEGIQVEEKIFKLLEAQPEKPVLDLKYSLRMCTEAGLTKACIKLYSMLNLPEEALLIALKVLSI